ncbi:MAG: hypothetical protein KIT84_07915 [Labilithrix sp.]|nr:hypothetical protein [Labilithrix sp.]MCW5810923.1 hypothetical protein [Labilithrix sp.]
MKCGTCGAELIGNAKFCPSCGTATASAPPKSGLADKVPPASANEGANMLVVPDVPLSPPASGASVNPFAATAPPGSSLPSRSPSSDALKAAGAAVPSNARPIAIESKSDSSAPAPLSPRAVSPLAVSNGISGRTPFQEAVEKARQAVPASTQPKKKTQGTQLMVNAPKLPAAAAAARAEAESPAEAPPEETKKRAVPKTVAMSPAPRSAVSGVGGGAPPSGVGAAPQSALAPSGQGPAPQSMLAQSGQGAAPQSMLAQSGQGSAPQSMLAPSGQGQGAVPQSMLAPSGQGQGPAPQSMLAPNSYVAAPGSVLGGAPNSYIAAPGSAIGGAPGSAIGGAPGSVPPGALGQQFQQHATPNPYAQHPAQLAPYQQPPSAAYPPPQWGAPPPGYGFQIVPGARVQVTWSNGQRYPATVSQVNGPQCLVVFPDGQQHWVQLQYLSPG